jgi:hypothetical protein
LIAPVVFGTWLIACRSGPLAEEGWVAMHATDPSPSGTTYEQLRAGAKKLGWHASIDLNADCKVHVFARDAEAVPDRAGPDANERLIRVCEPTPQYCGTLSADRGHGDAIAYCEAVRHGSPATAVMFSCTPAFDERCRARVDELLLASGLVPGPDPRSGMLVCRKGPETMQLEVPPGKLEEVRTLPEKAGYAAADCVFEPTSPNPPNP